MPYGKMKGKRAAFNNEGRYAFGGGKPVSPMKSQGKMKKRGMKRGGK